MSQFSPRKAWLERFILGLNKIEKGELISPNKAGELTGSNWNSAVNFINFIVERGIPVGHTESGEPKKLIFPPAGWAYMDEPSDLVKPYTIRCSCAWMNLILPGHATICPSCEERVWFMCTCGQQRDITNEKTFTCHKCGQTYVACDACFDIIRCPSYEFNEIACPSCGKLQTCPSIEGTVMSVDGCPLREAWVQLDGRITTTDDNGYFKFVNTPLGTFRIHITHPRHEDREALIDTSSTNRLTAYLPKKNPPQSMPWVIPVAFGVGCLLIALSS